MFLNVMAHRKKKEKHWFTQQLEQTNANLSVFIMNPDREKDNFE